MTRLGLVQRRWIGRFGNRLHQYAYGATYAQRFPVDYWTISPWEGDLLFAEHYNRVIEDVQLRETLCKSPNIDEADFDRCTAVEAFYRSRGQSILKINPDNGAKTWSEPSTNVTHDCVCAYHPGIFAGLSRDFLLRRAFRFGDAVTNSDIFRRFEDAQGTYDIAHLRRDDVARTDERTGYPCVSKQSYLKAFDRYGYDAREVQWSTDDEAGQWGVGSPLDFSLKKLGNVYPTGSVPDPDGQIYFDWFPDFLRLYFARSIFRANSSFSFWAAFLSNQRETPAVVYSPRIEKRIIYSEAETLGQELDCEFEEGNHPHWVMPSQSHCPDIVIN